MKKIIISAENLKEDFGFYWLVITPATSPKNPFIIEQVGSIDQRLSLGNSRHYYRDLHSALEYAREELFIRLTSNVWVLDGKLNKPINRIKEFLSKIGVMNYRYGHYMWQWRQERRFQEKQFDYFSDPEKISVERLEGIYTMQPTLNVGDPIFKINTNVNIYSDELSVFPIKEYKIETRTICDERESKSIDPEDFNFDFTAQYTYSVAGSTHFLELANSYESLSARILTKNSNDLIFSTKKAALEEQKALLDRLSKCIQTAFDNKD